MKIADVWRERLAGAEALVSNDLEARAGIVGEYEDKAQGIIEELVGGVLAEYADAAGVNGSSSFCVEVPEFVVGTAAYRQFETWINDEGLSVSPMGYEKGNVLLSFVMIEERGDHPSGRATR